MLQRPIATDGSMAERPRFVRFEGTLNSLDSASVPDVPTTLGLPSAWDEEALDEHPSPELIAAVREVLGGHDVMDRVMNLLQKAPLWLETEVASGGGDRVVRTLRAEGLRWLPLFSSRTLLARFAQASGRGSAEITYGSLTGAEVLDELLPQLPRGTGIVLDPVSDHVLALPSKLEPEPGPDVSANSDRLARPGADQRGA
ncbi:hypothetical protein GIY23_09245 [Allosaccharopolyspora coralli]|uniref:SseB protein N-terminal domain-containing protein n=1 Tax=Allosaccharopolyspora coralli TaxID=2665642 RepID=A0A5Q3QDV6_9PSEU|nr:SseB family protein [Allosaccharopolyspora coralli]QGK69679.1 hypothetical protein GIY23_09245 [Allosaccharopolyspora coralli]